MLLAPVSGLAAPASLDAVSQQLTRIQKQLERLKKTGQIRNRTLVDIERKIHRLDKQLTALSAEMFDIDKRMRVRKKRQQQLRARQRTLRRTLERQRQLLARQLRFQYSQARRIRTTAMLRAPSLQQYGRTQRYFDYFLRARRKAVVELAQRTTDVHEVTRKLENESTRLAALKQRMDQKRQQLATIRKQQQAVLASLTRQQEKDRKTVAELTRNRAELSRLLAKLREQAKHSGSVGDTGFARLKGKLGWPINGRVSKSRLPGVTIHAAEPGPVRAIARGRVAFAEPMRGFGRLVIINHGGGYMSLYGNNQTLSVTAGQSVEQGQTIATAGANQAIYFGIRQRATPVDPRQWCH